ncbi:hypothetical protein ACFYZI_40840 [Streptomyces griseorubiginosus]|uniref:hypothetical protein n=1 Tax=Streptomyces griseorubiginosus TaxID=67304 RepID=UPI0036A67080
MDRVDEILARAAQERQELEEMNARYEAMGHEEYVDFMAEMDARDAARGEQA